ncbi:MAG: ferredoxin:protochlorophyllide reductase (ATP-dependent) subunit B [Chloroflexota bacterium]|nr:ferredoxin:protochlorophyllide reductase (ATP-dependent) subunit B [Chloroflexota bacterium]
MRMSYWEYQGTAHTGVARVANSMNGVYAIMYSPVGDTYINSMFTMIERNKRFPPVTTSVLDLQTMGMGVNRLAPTLEQVYADHHPDLMIVACTCSSILLQEDLGALTKSAELPEGKTEVLIYAPNPYRVEEDEAANGLLTLLTKRYATVALPPTPKPSVNIIGTISLGFHHKQDLVSLKRMLNTLGVEVNLVFPEGASIPDLKRLPQAWATIAPYREMGQDAAKVLEELYGIPAVLTTPLGVMATREWVRAVIAALSKFAAAHNLPYNAEEPALAAFSMDQHSTPSNLPWFTYTADVQSFSSRKAFVFGDFTHTVGLVRLLATELDVQVVGAGTYDKRREQEFLEAVAPYTKETIISVEFDKVRKKIGELQPDVVLGTQMERHTSAGFDIPCATISNPTHIEDFPLGYQPFLGYDGSNYITDRIYHTMTLGLEKHLIEMFGDAGLGTSGAELPTEKINENFRHSEELRVKAEQLAVDGGSVMEVKPTPAPEPAKAPVGELTWTSEATQALKQIPFFVRPKVHKRVEEYARQHGHSVITLDLVYEVKEKAG